ncbi:hypothetical protein FNF28_05547 [Cafeteria roenbergensis]|uniref:Helicase C-terminal domain-containing protein n=1 Tax=Cafeteria roenbergensis TaxID=33653 RepID=A0A5A8D5B7_CAFRO|nr:hypothetical protein FNF28_05547 [Cafeteria roenbergensis]
MAGLIDQMRMIVGNAAECDLRSVLIRSSWKLDRALDLFFREKRDGKGAAAGAMQKTASRFFSNQGAATAARPSPPKPEPKGRSSPIGIDLTPPAGARSQVCVVPPPPPAVPCIPATLVVCPVSLLGQWAREIERFTPQGHLRVVIHHGTSRLLSARQLEGVDVVITSYGMVAHEMHRLGGAQAAADVALAAASTGRGGGAGAPGGPATKQGRKGAAAAAASAVVYGARWRRVVLDEAHAIKNTSTDTSRSCLAIEAVHRWALTGTPVQNSLKDLHSLVRFMRHQPWDEPAWWRRVIAQPFEAGDPRALPTLQALLRPLLLRRTKGMRDVDGRPIVVLPPKSEELVWLALSESERAFYDAIYSRSKATFEGFEAAGTVLNQYAVILSLLVRLRQACDHPFLVLGRRSNGPKLGDSPDDDADSSRADGAGLSSALVTRLLRRFMDSQAAQSTEEHEATTASDSDDDDGLSGDSDFEEPAAAAQSPDSHRGGVMAPADDDGAVSVLSSGDEAVSFSDSSSSDNDEDDEDFVTERAAPAQLAPIFGGADAGAAGAAASSPAATPGGGQSPRGDEGDDAAFGTPAAWAHRGDPIAEEAWPGERLFADVGIYSVPTEEVPTAAAGGKLEAEEARSSALAIMDGPASDGALWRSLWLGDVKVVVFSQFTSMLDVVQAGLRRRGTRFGRIDGSMTQPRRDAALASFRQRAGANVLLVSTKAGGQGLNVVEACVVFILDPWWNPATEQQAISRVHRIGQRRRVTVKRLLCSDTVEETLIELQRSKQQLADSALEAGATASSGKLTLDDLRRFFR